MSEVAANKAVLEAIEKFDFPGKFIDYARHGNGHINDTYMVRFEQEDGSVKKYILQRINTAVFKNPDAVMENIGLVSEFIREKVEANGGDPEREALTIVFAKDGKPFFDAGESFFRAYLYIDGAVSYEAVEKPEDFYEAGFAFGRFQYLLSEFKADNLSEVIPGFHDTGARFERFKEVVKEDKVGRCKEAAKEIQFVLDRAADMTVCMDKLREGKLPLRVTHNDTKLNNVMMDEKSGKAVCVVDLDTVMPGLSINDFGDAIRFGANTAAEDEVDLSKVSLSLDLFEIYTKGFLDGCNNSLTDEELRMLPMGAKMMTLECGMRFLTDFLEGDVYFKIHRDNHNLDRARCQLALVADMEKKMSEMEQIVQNISK